MHFVIEFVNLCHSRDISMCQEGLSTENKEQPEMDKVKVVARIEEE
jgi:hypothetical protein